MGKQRFKTIQIVVCLVCIIFTLSTFSSGCSIKKVETNESLVTSWIRKQISSDGKPMYPKDARAVLSAPLTVTFPDILAYRGSILSEKKQWDGVFFIHKKTHTIQFLDAYNQ